MQLNGILFGLPVITIASIVFLKCRWPSCEDINWTSSAVSDLAVTSISPGYGETKGRTLVSIRGTGFMDGVRVSFGDKVVKDIEVKIADSTHLFVPSPEQKTNGIFDIVVTNPDKKSRVLSPGFLYVKSGDQPPKPYINSLSPNSGPLTGGQPVTIKGTGFRNSTSVSFGGLPGTDLRVQNDTTLMVITPAHGTGKVDIVVDAGDSTTSPESYTYNYWVKTHLLV